MFKLNFTEYGGFSFTVIPKQISVSGPLVATSPVRTGVASHLAQVALDDARAQGLRVIPRCPFVADYIARHPEYADLVEPSA